MRKLITLTTVGLIALAGCSIKFTPNPNADPAPEVTVEETVEASTHSCELEKID
jgi:multidrug efflux pump subunit AcrA (membrane-fusion protein)